MTGRHLPPTHRGRSTRRIPSVPARLGLAAGLLLALVGVPGTYAYWTGQGTLASETFTSGVLDVRLSGDDGNPVAWSNPALSLTDMLPGESVAADLPVQNVGNVPLRYTASATGSGALAAYLTVEAFPGGASSNGTAGGLRIGSCTGTGLGPATLPGTLVGTPQQIPAGGAQQLCLVVTLAPSAPSSAQAATGGLTVSFAATQVGAP